MKSGHFWTNAIIVIIYFFQSECISLLIRDRPVNLQKEMLQADE